MFNIDRTLDTNVNRVHSSVLEKVVENAAIFPPFSSFVDLLYNICVCDTELQQQEKKSMNNWIIFFLLHIYICILFSTGARIAAASETVGGPTESICRIHGYPSAGSRNNSISNRNDVTAHQEFLSGPSSNSRFAAPFQGPHHGRCTADLHRSCFCVRFIAEHTRTKEESLRVLY